MGIKNTEEEMKKSDIDLTSLTKLPKRFLIEQEEDKSVVIVSSKVNKSEINSDKKWDKVNKIVEDWAKLNRLEVMSTGNCLCDMTRDWYLKKSSKISWLDKYIDMKNRIISKIEKYFNNSTEPADCKEYGKVISYYDDYSGEWTNFTPVQWTDIVFIDEEGEEHEFDDINLIDLCTFLDWLQDNFIIMKKKGNVVK